MREPTNLVALTEDVVASIQTLAEGRGSPIEIHSPGGHFEAEVDPRRIRRIKPHRQSIGYHTIGHADRTHRDRRRIGLEYAIPATGLP